MSAATLYRTHLGDVVSFDGRVGTVIALEADDALDVVTGLPTSATGKRYGRMALIDCGQSLCTRCGDVDRPPGFRDVWGNRWWGHYADECELSPVTLSPLLENAQEIEGALF